MNDSHKFFDQVEYEDERLYNNIKKVADSKFGIKNSLMKSIWLISEYKSHSGRYKFNPKRKIRDNVGFLSRLKKKKSNQSKLKVNVSRAARQFLLQQEILQVQSNTLLTEEEKNFLTIDLDYLTNTTDRKIIEYIRAGENDSSAIEFLDKKAHTAIRKKSIEKFGPNAATEIIDSYTYRAYKNAGLPVKYHQNFGPSNSEPQGLAPESSTWKLPRASDKDLRFKSVLQSNTILTPEEKSEMLVDMENLSLERNRRNKELEERMNKEITFQQYPGV